MNTLQKKTHICIVSPSLKLGGIERVLTILANYFVLQDNYVTFISCLSGGRFYNISNQIKVIEPEFRHSGLIVSKIIFYPRIAHFVRKIVMKVNPDVVLVFGDLFSPLVLLSLIGLKYPIYISDRTSPNYKFRFPIPQLKKWLYPKSAGFIAQTKKAADYNRKLFGSKLNICVIPNPVRDIKLFPDISREKKILYVGRFAWEKGPERLIRAFKAIPDRQGWQLYMVGSGPLLERMKQLASDLEIDDELVFYGKVKDIDRLYSKASIFVLPSLLEGFPNSLCEAMAAGLPCICFDSIPHEEILTNGVDGIAVKNGDISDLAATIIRLMMDKSLREQIGARAREIRNRLNIESIGEQITDFIFEE